ncbi:MAG: methyl-accepting chemotaxis protein, partial [Treponemataceae bacterium]|nr:methyl-accepting chemotaxis protein [Treponemataceae bacterium]
AYKVEITVFDALTRVSTTMGGNVLGTKLDNADIIGTVRGGRSYFGETTLTGKSYLSIYSPLTDSSGAFTGILLAAKPMQAITVAQRKMMLIIIPVIIALIAVLVIVSFVSLKRMLGPLVGVKTTLVDISSGDADLTKRIDLHSEDEVGDVVKGFNAFAGKLQAIIADVKHSKDDLVVAGDDM